MGKKANIVFSEYHNQLFEVYFLMSIFTVVPDKISKVNI
ncbi:hypothetical protein NIES4102_38110 [Chondrocystis sp. NIES-4102]|nr:hypothetical protein NIES4102_38110 [Chondrocystis sp. NIES-4102]